MAILRELVRARTCYATRAPPFALHIELHVELHM